MKISLEWLSDFVDTKPIRADMKAFASKMAMRGVEVESIQDLSKGFEKVIVAQIETRDRHPNADRLSVCQVKTGSETLQIVCGAQNMKAGDKVALSQVGALLPNGLKIEKSKIRDVESFGMLCSEVELGLAEKSEGILILPSDAPVGTDLSEFLGLDDVVFELNVTPNRGDVLSHLGFAREAAAALGQKLQWAAPKPKAAKGEPGVAIKIEDRTKNGLCYQFFGQRVDKVRIGPSPEKMQKRLKAVGLRPINNIVDVTNYVLMEMGQPLHAYDAAKLKGTGLIARLAVAGEKIPLLNNTTATLTSSDLVIADQEKPVALAGVMGGANSEVSNSTTQIVLEAAQFAPATVRRSSKRFQAQSDSSYRFERQVDARGVAVALERALQLIEENSGGKRVGAVGSAQSETGKALTAAKQAPIRVTAEELRVFLGVDLTAAQATSALKEAGFQVRSQGGEKKKVLLATPPSYRPDLHGFEDLSEEVLRVHGYDKVPAVVPNLYQIPDPRSSADNRAAALEKIRSILAEEGFSEAINFAFVSEKSNQTWGDPLWVEGGAPAEIVRLKNPLNEDLAIMKTTLVGGLYKNLELALNHQQPDVRLFEIRPVFIKDAAQETGVREEWRIGMMATGRAYLESLAARDRSIDFFDMKGIFEKVLEALAVRGLRYQPFTNWDDTRVHQGQAAVVSLGKGPCGILARLHPKWEDELKTKNPITFVEVSLDRLLELSKTDRKYHPIAKFPKVLRDFSLLAPEGMAVEKILQTIQKLGRPLVETVQVVDLYRGEKIGAGKFSVSIALVLGDPNRTLAEAEVEDLSKKLLSGLGTQLDVHLRLS